MQNYKYLYINRIQQKEKICTFIPVFKYKALIICSEENPQNIKK
jgi:hypothetical protein